MNTNHQQRLRDELLAMRIVQESNEQDEAEALSRINSERALLNTYSYSNIFRKPSVFNISKMKDKSKNEKDNIKKTLSEKSVSTTGDWSTVKTIIGNNDGSVEKFENITFTDVKGKGLYTGMICW